MEEKLLSEIEKRLETIDESINYQINSLCELSSIIHTINYFLFLMTNEKSRVKNLEFNQE